MLVMRFENDLLSNRLSDQSLTSSLRLNSLTLWYSIQFVYTNQPVITSSV